MPISAPSAGGDVQEKYMFRIISGAVGALCLLAAWVVHTVPAQSLQNYEPLPTFSASKVLPAKLMRGPGYSVGETVRNDGFVNMYQLRTRFGTFAIKGTDLLRIRSREVAALTKMEEITAGGSIANSAAQSATKTLRTAGGLVTKPVKTLSNTVKGVGRWFGRAGASASATDPQREKVIASISGASSARRDLAYKFGVDPYSRFAPLKTRLTELASASAVGSVATNIGLAFVPGGAGIAISIGGTSETLRSLLRDKTIAELEKMGRQRLGAMGVSKGATNAFYRNVAFTPTDKALIVEALTMMRGVSGRNVLIGRAIEISSPDTAFFFRRRLEQTAAYHTKVAPISSFISLGGVPMARAGDGIIGIFPIDHLVWTQFFAEIVSAVDEDRKNLSGAISLKMWLTGSASQQAVSNLNRRGWTVKQNVGSLLGN
jgi:hypothetical protein